MVGGQTFRFDLLHARHAVDTLFFNDVLPLPSPPPPPAAAAPPVLLLPPPLITEVDDSPVGLGRPDAEPGSSEVGDGPGASWR